LPSIDTGRNILGSDHGPGTLGGVEKTEPASQLSQTNCAPSLIDHPVTHIRPPEGAGYLYQLLAIWSWTSLLWLHRLRQRTLITAGTDDPVVPLLKARILEYLIPQAELVTFDDGHLFLITSANRVAPVDRGFSR
jgi:pimeloyl-ACP methyl ester carboxylesterase